MYSLYFLYLLSLDAVGGHILVVSIGIVRTIGDCPSLRGEGQEGRGDNVITDCSTATHIAHEI